MSMRANDLLVADIGGTNARFARASRRDEGICLHDVLELRVADFATLATAVEHYRSRLPGTHFEHAVLAIACPVGDSVISMTNSHWRFPVESLAQELRLASVRLINDFAAIAHSVGQLVDQDVAAIGGMQPVSVPFGRSRQLAVLGPGTGLGVARLSLDADHASIIDTECGHIGFSPGNALECRVLEHLLQQHPRVSAERLISGPGLRRLHRAHQAVLGTEPTDIGPAEITAAAEADSRGPEAQSLELFCALLGSFAGDAVLALGGWDGVYLAGGITPRLMPWLQRGEFRRRFESKGRFQSRMQGIPTHAILHRQPGLLGAAACGLAD